MALLYPETSYVDLEFKDGVPDFPPQLVADVVCVGLNAFAFVLERRRFGGGRLGGVKEI